MANPVRKRLLELAELAAPADVKPTLAYLERRAGLATGALKDCTRRKSVTKAVASGLVSAAPRLGVMGLTRDWLIDGDGSPPHAAPTPQAAGGTLRSADYAAGWRDAIQSIVSHLRTLVGAADRSAVAEAIAEDVAVWAVEQLQRRQGPQKERRGA